MTNAIKIVRRLFYSKNILHCLEVWLQQEQAWLTHIAHALSMYTPFSLMNYAMCNVPSGATRRTWKTRLLERL